MFIYFVIYFDYILLPVNWITPSRNGATIHMWREAKTVVVWFTKSHSVNVSKGLVKVNGIIQDYNLLLFGIFHIIVFAHRTLYNCTPIFFPKFKQCLLCSNNVWMLTSIHLKTRISSNTNSNIYNHTGKLFTLSNVMFCLKGRQNIHDLPELLTNTPHKKSFRLPWDLLHYFPYNL